MERVVSLIKQEEVKKELRVGDGVTLPLWQVWIHIRHNPPLSPLGELIWEEGKLSARETRFCLRRTKEDRNAKLPPKKAD